MQINPIGIGGYTDPAMASQAVDSVSEHKESKIETLIDMLESPSPETEKLRDIASFYDVTSIQPKELSEMLGRLYEAGVLTEEEYQSLGMLRIELEKAGFEIDEPVNLIKFCQGKLDEIADKLEAMEKVIEGSQESAKLQLSWLEKMAIIQDDPQAIGLNALV